MVWNLIVVLFLLMATSTKAAEMPPFSAEGSWTASSMLPFCKSEHAAKHGGPCTGYVVAIYDEMRSRSLRTWIAVTSGPGREAPPVEEVRARGGCVMMSGQMTINEIRKTVIDWIEQHWDEYLLQPPARMPAGDRGVQRYGEPSFILEEGRLIQG